MAGLAVHDVDDGHEYELRVDEAGLPDVDELLRIEVTDGEWKEFMVLKREFNYGGTGTHVILQVREARAAGS